MKKLLFIIIFLSFIVAIETIGIDELNGVFTVEIENIKTDSIEFKIESKNNLNYKLFKNEEIILSGSFLDTKLLLSDLDSSTDYSITFTDNVKSKKIDFKTKSYTTIRFGGDIMMTSFFEGYIDRYGVDYMWNDVANLLKSADYSFFNLETSVSNRGVTYKPEGYGFRSKPSSLAGLKNASIDFLNIANNHILDYGLDAFNDTLDNLNQYGFLYAGAGQNKKKAFEPIYAEVNDLKISFISATSILGFNHWEALEDRPGVAYLHEKNYDLLIENVKEASKNSDHVIVNFHWGDEYDNFPKEKHEELSKKLIDAGASLIIGHHPHVLQGVEYYNGGVIFYSIGNFNFLVSSENTMQTGLFEVILSKDKILSSKIYPIKINNCKANLLNQADGWYGTIINNLNTRSSKYNTIVEFDGNIKKK